MRVFFAGTYYFLALMNPSDPAHQKAVVWASRPQGTLVTTAWVLVELADAMCAPVNRSTCLTLISRLRTNPSFEIVAPDMDLFDRGLSLFASRPDKAWSLTDCISFVVMTDRGLTDALTGDRHFEQAGFRVLLRA
jgi:predicted nucleic acid-binding protein